jgi:hypothetical protein
MLRGAIGFRTKHGATSTTTCSMDKGRVSAVPLRMIANRRALAADNI